MIRSELLSGPMIPVRFGVVGNLVGARAAVGAAVFDGFGARVGVRFGTRVGARVGLRVGARVGARVGTRFLTRVGDRVGARVGMRFGARVEARVGTRVGVCGAAEGLDSGSPRFPGKLQCLQPSACVRHCALPQHSAVTEQLVHMARQDPSSLGKMKKPLH